MTLRKFIWKHLYLIGITVFVATACYQPTANRTDEFENETPKEIELTEEESTSNSQNSETTNVTSKTETNTMTDSTDKPPVKAQGYRGNLSIHLEKHGHTIADVVDESSGVERRLLDEYGAVFLTKAVPPSKVMFTSESEVSNFQSKAGLASANVGGISVELQPAASESLEAAFAEAKGVGLSITPRDPKDSARRSYEHTYTLWNGRFTKACEHWRSKGKLTSAKIDKLKSLPIKQQVAEVLALEKQGIYFSTHFDKSILYSVAAPGTSQHLSMLAFDAKEFSNKKVRAILAKHGWFRTVQSDAPHFTYLGYAESELPSLGLKKVTTSDGGFWIPDV